MKDVPLYDGRPTSSGKCHVFRVYFYGYTIAFTRTFANIKRWSPMPYGHYAGLQTFLNVFVFFLIFAGIILDKMGVSFTAILSGSRYARSTSINYFAVSNVHLSVAVQNLS